MSFEETIDLCEYDEFEPYDVKTFQTTSSSEHGVPLSVELSESLFKSQTLVNEQISNSFVKAPEIFLRFDSSNISGKNSISDASKQNNVVDVANESNCEENTISVEPEENDDVITRENCIELEYENDFDDRNDETGGSNVRAINKQNNSSNNDFEELLLEGIEYTNNIIFYITQK